MPTSADFSRLQKGYALVTGFIECFLFGGIIYGWADLVYVMKAEGIFHDECTNSTSMYLNYGKQVTFSCKKQDDLFDKVFTIATFGRGLGALFVSLLLDYTGLRITRLVGIFSLILGGFFTGYSSKEHPYFLFPGLLLIALGGTEIRLADFKIANMFPRHKATVMSIYNGAFSGSGVVFLALKYVCNKDNDRPIFMYIWTSISALMLFPTFCLLPKSNIEAIDEVDDLRDSEHDDMDVQQLISPNESDPPSETTQNSIFRSLYTVSYWLHVYSAGNIAVGIMLYIASFNMWLHKVTSNREEVNYLSEVYGFCQLPMILVAPLVGIAMDNAVKKALIEPEEVMKRKKLQQAGFLSLICVSIAVTFLIICRIFHSVLSVQLSLALYTIAYPTMNAVVPGYLRIRFHQDHFNKLMGLLGTISTIYSILQFALFKWMQRDPFTSNIVIAVLMATTLVNALHLLFIKVK